MAHFGIYVKQTALLNIHVLFLCLYKIYILIILKCHVILKFIDIAILSKYRIDIVSKLKSFYWIIINPTPSLYLPGDSIRLTVWLKFAIKCLGLGSHILLGVITGPHKKCVRQMASKSANSVSRGPATKWENVVSHHSHIVVTLIVNYQNSRIFETLFHQNFQDTF